MKYERLFAPTNWTSGRFSLKPRSHYQTPHSPFPFLRLFSHTYYSIVPVSSSISLAPFYFRLSRRSFPYDRPLYIIKDRRRWRRRCSLCPAEQRIFISSLSHRPQAVFPSNAFCGIRLRLWHPCFSDTYGRERTKRFNRVTRFSRFSCRITISFLAKQKRSIVNRDNIVSYRHTDVNALMKTETLF